jgi:hypothetical protein
MASRTLALDHDGERVPFELEGDSSWGDPKVLLDRADRTRVSLEMRPWRIT